MEGESDKKTEFWADRARFGVDHAKSTEGNHGKNRWLHKKDPSFTVDRGSVPLFGVPKPS